MADLATDTILKIVVSMLLPESVIAQNVFWALFENTGGSADEDDVMDDLADWVEAVYSDFLIKLDTEWSLDDIAVYQYDAGDDDFDEVGKQSVTGVGLVALDFLPHGAAIVTNANTTDSDVQGRKFWTGFTEGANANGLVDGAMFAAIALVVDEWISPFVGAATGSDFVPGVYSLTRAAFSAFNQDSTFNIPWGYQRRRKPGVGM